MQKNTYLKIFDKEGY